MEGQGPVIISIGGNALIRRSGSGKIEEQFASSEAACRAVASVLERGRRVVVTHGNGPVVGNIVIRNEAARNVVPPMPLYICDADSEGGVGFMVQQTIHNLLRKAGGGKPPDVAAIVTQVVVDPADPAFTEPTKPIGPYYTSAEAEALRAGKGWTLAEDSGRGWRRVVPSPRPVRLVEAGVVKKLMESDVVVIAAGGGGVPVTESPDGTLHGVDAVVDKDYATALLAREVGAGTLINLTQVDMVYSGFNTPARKGLPRLSSNEARALLEAGEFPPGSMGPKIESALDFLSTGGGEVVITSPEKVLDALEGRAGTLITP